MKTGEVPTSCAGQDRLLAFDTPLQLGARQVHFDQDQWMGWGWGQGTEESPYYNPVT